jgi:hypothetical protein
VSVVFNEEENVLEAATRRMPGGLTGTIIKIGVANTEGQAAALLFGFAVFFFFLAALVLFFGLDAFVLEPAPLPPGLRTEAPLLFFS